jgi:hypothetical protein
MIKKSLTFIILSSLVLTISFINSYAAIPDTSIVWVADETVEGYVYAEGYLDLSLSEIEINSFYFEVNLGFWANYLTDSVGSYESKIEFYKGSDILVSVSTLEFQDYYKSDIIDDHFQDNVRFDLYDLFDYYDFGYIDLESEFPEAHTVADVSHIIFTFYYEEQYKDTLASQSYWIIGEDLELYIVAKTYSIRKWVNDDIIDYYEVYGSVFTLLSVPFSSDRPQAPNPYVEYEFINWTVRDTDNIVVDSESLVDYANGLGIVDVNANFQLVSIYGSSTDPTPETEGKIPLLFASLNLDTLTGYVLAYLISIIITVVIMVKFNINNIASLVVIIAITGIFNYLGFLPLLVSILIYLALTIVLIFNLRGGSAND